MPTIYGILDNWSNAINPFSHVFWSGKDLAGNGAKYLANEICGKTFEMTRLGTYLCNNFSGDNYNALVWNAGLQLFANQVSNNSTVFLVQNLYDFNSLSVWVTIEEPILIEKVSEIIRIVFGGR